MALAGLVAYIIRPMIRLTLQGIYKKFCVKFMAHLRKVVQLTKAWALHKLTNTARGSRNSGSYQLVEHLCTELSNFFRHHRISQLQWINLWTGSTWQSASARSWTLPTFISPNSFSFSLSLTLSHSLSLSLTLSHSLSFSFSLTLSLTLSLNSRNHNCSQMILT